MFTKRKTNVRIEWDGYVRSQLAWWMRLSQLARDPQCPDFDYVSDRARKALENARHPAHPISH